ncbi:hypothetical protein [Spiroplasma turonicum]|uniref:Uncharacterized protein n=1 Tax=Spiroplasma turonicum TaxID=216946 RepID=A0A0K1P6A5_9MOLU|nr:hypothetical protein [Spiroplasma turonicum]AKU79853.1 hypothetical protein STURON_00607 [Spiroplasma turonicum]ALX70870.1 hypothetical protein STURO_v1c06050 [Spiroplasma turonicum]
MKISSLKEKLINNELFDEELNIFLNSGLFHNLPKCFTSSKNKKNSFLKIIEYFETTNDDTYSSLINIDFETDFEKLKNFIKIIKSKVNYTLKNANGWKQKKGLPSASFLIQKSDNFLRKISVPHFLSYIFQVFYFLINKLMIYKIINNNINKNNLFKLFNDNKNYEEISYLQQNYDEQVFHLNNISDINYCDFNSNNNFSKNIQIKNEKNLVRDIFIK